jgi:DNA polymerase bacteriophage-type
MKHEPMPDLSTAQAESGAHKLHRDFETRSTVDLTKVGSHIYANHPTTEIICVSFAVDNQPVKLWWPGDPVPAEWFEAARNPNWTARAHNDPFESTIEEHKLHPLYGFPLIPPERHRCTMAMSLALGLPAKLSKLADALEFVHRKDKGGERLMHQMSKPRRPRKGEDPDGVYWHEEEDKKQRLGAYNMQDVEAEREADDRLSQLSDSEQVIWALSNKINERGVHIDRKFAEAARKIAEAVAPEINDEIVEITEGAVERISQVDRLKQWLQSQGCPAPKLDSEAIEKLLENDELPAKVNRALRLRLDGAQAATRKIDAILAYAAADDRVRGTFVHHGASTGRWVGKGPQLQNLKKPETEEDGLDAAMAAIATGDYAHVKALYPKPLSVIGDCTRLMITAAPGRLLIGGDFSSVESRVLAWIAHETWKVEAYYKFDETGDPCLEPYCETACKIFRVPSGSFTKKSPERAVGKTGDLSFGYMGGLNAWRKFEPDQFTDDEVTKFKVEWRNAHSKIVRFWRNIDCAAIEAVRERGSVIRCGKLTLSCVGAFLWIKLPSGRKLSYPYPRIIQDKKYGGSRVLFSDNGGGKFVDCRHGDGAYGGTWTENVVSGIARDLLTEAMLRIEASGYPIVMHVHDELACEVPEGFGSEQEFVELMTRKPAWAGDLPIAASAWSGPRYLK